MPGSVTRLLSLSVCLSLFLTSAMSGVDTILVGLSPFWSQLAVITPGWIVLPGSRFRGERKSLLIPGQSLDFLLIEPA